MNWKSILRFKCVGVVLALALMMIPVGYVAATDMDYDWDRGGHGYYIVDPIKTDAGYASGTTIDAIWIHWLDFNYTLHTSAELIGEIGKQLRVYRGIPYAAPPVGNLR